MQKAYVISYLKGFESVLHCDYSTVQRFLVVYPPIYYQNIDLEFCTYYVHQK